MSRKPASLSASPLLLLALVAALAGAVTFSTTVAQLDGALGRLARTTAEGVATQLGPWLSSLGGTEFVMPATALAALVLIALKHWRGAVTLVCAVLASQGVVQLIKVVVERPRPAANHGLASASGFSFPSAHSATSMALYATLGMLAARACARRGMRAVALGSASTLIVAIGLSRLVLGAHYPIDVFAGWLTGAAVIGGSWLFACSVMGRLERSALPA